MRTMNPTAARRRTFPLTSIDRCVSIIINIVGIVDELYHLVFDIRNPAIRLGFSKAFTYSEIDPDTEVNIIDGYRAVDLNHLKDLFRSYNHAVSDDPEDLHYLVRHLVKANTRRRQQFKYWRNHKIKHERVIIPASVPLAQTDTIACDASKPLDVQIGHLALAAPLQPSSTTRSDPAKVKLDDDLSGQLKKAEEPGMQVIEVRKQVLGPEHPGTLTSMANLASTYRNQGRWKEAKELEVQVMEIRRQGLGPVHPDTPTSMANTAYTFHYKEDIHDAAR
ncbi:hypothetical protein BJX63DRAFT_433767 [Aspergillus granulosus]|uniref:Kinesin light chain n=1 Tax=Aspergillus granulosus TaxID=176169 RepID=A0ABR4H811_9EURO